MLTFLDRWPTPVLLVAFTRSPRLTARVMFWLDLSPQSSSRTTGELSIREKWLGITNSRGLDHPSQPSAFCALTLNSWLSCP